ncbi:hypothetical protein RGUI_1135 [Rhodovulum sp. P5]|uniref:DNA gyrase inhibitor YacG n=1 Tax=Rhodovulum sp. P5 TaxID=1564506 RepID=UPI0009C3DB5E|nr:DNA gyrase inhibitor YacG [Rhodovulum sp. P5]ARE39276.1 hypothetical protein RGUI_1135 [Rhodovulum sp. P5]
MTCPICKKPSSPDYRPFCSRRCADIDLGKWLSGSYTIPGESVAVADHDEAQRPRNGEPGDS